MKENLPDFTDEDLYKGLQALSDLSFPKVCNTCGNRYETIQEFISRTEKIRRSSGLKEEFDDDDRKILALFRNCTCGSTLMDEFNDRRNLSEAGIKRRETFGGLMEKLSSKGISPKVARAELLKIMKGEGSKLLNVKSASD